MSEFDGEAATEVQGPLVPDYYTVSELTERWGATKEDIRGWCKEGYISDAYLSGNRYLIPADAVRPLDEKLAKEIMWQLLEHNGSVAKLDLSDKGVGDILPEYLKALKTENYVKCAGSNLLHLNRKGLKLLGRYGDNRKDKGAFEIMTFAKPVLSAAGSVVGALAGKMLTTTGAS